MVTVMTYMRFWHGGLNFSDGYLRYPADEEQEEGKEEPEASQEHQTIPDGWGEVSPTRWQEVPAQEVMVITKRSNHMPMFTKIDTIHMTHTLVRSFLNQKICGEMTLHETIVQ